MFCGQRDTIIDEKWRLIITANKELGSYVLLREGDDGCIQIHRPSIALEQAQYPFAFRVKLMSANGKSNRRISIPPSLRDSVSFFYGRTVILAGYRDYVVIWPRPKPHCSKRVKRKKR